MVNYLTLDPDVREYVEGAIGMVQKIMQEDMGQIKKMKVADGSWF